MILDDIVAKKKIRVEERKRLITPKEIYNIAISINKEEKENRFKKVLEARDLSIIGEFKKASPSKGIIVDRFNLDEILDLYEELDIDAYSILTEEDFFFGKDDYLKSIRKKSERPILRKDFIVDTYQIYETKIIGASGILLIVAVLGENLGEFYKESKDFGLEPLVEVHNQEELEIALKYNCEVIGVNNRNLKTFKTALETTEKLVEFIPEDKVIISESGINTIEDLKRIREAGVSGVLIGEMFMRNIGNEVFKKEFRSFKGYRNAY